MNAMAEESGAVIRAASLLAQRAFPEIVTRTARRSASYCGTGPVISGSQPSRRLRY